MKYKCPKCTSETIESGKIRVAKGFWSKLITPIGYSFFTVTCVKCGYTELYKKTEE